ncbi:MAG TPA: hypothetical protein VEK34_14200 [Methylocella sp.]|nr:hypothetical protein [Methylocella sp.]
MSHGSTVTTWQVSSAPALVQEASAGIVAGGQDPGFFTTVSSNGNATGSAIIWAVGRPSDGTTTAVTLYAFDARPSGNPATFNRLYSAPAGSWPNTGGNANIVPVVANGKVYVASAYLDATGNTRGQLNIFGAGGTASPLVSSVAPLASTHAISGTVLKTNGPTVTLQTRTGTTATVDISQVMEKRAHLLKEGAHITAEGSSVGPTGALLATAVVHAKGRTGDLWPPNR